VLLLGVTAAIAAAADGPWVILDFTGAKEVQAGEPFAQWMKQAGWEARFGNPVHFFIGGGALHLVAKSGPVFRNRVLLALTDRERLKAGMENKVMLQVASGKDFRIDLKRFPVLRFRMAAVVLPGKGADLRNSAKNDACFYLLVGFDTPTHQYEGVSLPETVAYVWADQVWAEPVGKDPDYAAFMRYIPIGAGADGLGQPHEVVRNVAQDFRLAYPEHQGAPVPDVTCVGVLIDSNTVDSTAESSLEWVRFEAEGR
jgi:hypothetical protein